MANQSFEESMNRLNQIIRSLETDNPNLDAALSLFAEGTELIQSCNRMLDSAEQKVSILKNGEQVPFTAEGE